MQITITGHHVEVTPALRAYVTEKMQRLTRHFDHVISVNVILNVTNWNLLLIPVQDPLYVLRFNIGEKATYIGDEEKFARGMGLYSS